MSQPPPDGRQPSSDGPDLTKRPDSGGTDSAHAPANPYGQPSSPSYGQPPDYGQSAPGYGQSTPDYGQSTPGSGGYGDSSAGQPGQQSAPYGASGGSYDQSYGNAPAGNVPATGYGAGGGDGGYNYGSPQAYGNYAPAGPSKGLAIASLVLGIIGVLGAWVPFVGLFFGFLGLIGLVLGIIALVQAKKGRAGGKPAAIIGIIASIVAMLLSIGSTVAATYVIGKAATSSASDWSSSLESMATEQASMSTDTEDILANKLDVTFGTAEITGDPNVPDTRVPVTLTNKSGVEARYTLTVAATKNGVETETDFITTTSMDPGETLETDAFDFVIKADNLRDAEFEVKDATFMPS